MENPVRVRKLATTPVYTRQALECPNEEVVNDERLGRLQMDLFKLQHTINSQKLQQVNNSILTPLSMGPILGRQDAAQQPYESYT